MISEPNDMKPEETAAPETQPVIATEPVPPEEAHALDTQEPLDAETQMRRVSRRSFLWAGAMTAGALGGLWAFNRYAPDDGTGIKANFRKGLEFNEAFSKRVFFSPTHQDRAFPRSAAVEPRNNYHGETPIVDLEAWTLMLEGAADGPKTLTLADLKALPAVSQTTELKCVEGWSAVVNWTGVRFADFVARYPPPPGTTYVAMRSEPEGWDDEWYYVGLDMASCLHPQTLLAYAMNDAPLTPEHGAPLRLVMPHKYGIKNIKLITKIAYSNERPADYWAEQGYDYYAGL
jgi:DMSO/TMAO reductase YedYZ molybdopterin-dependent catalytic subunit